MTMQLMSLKQVISRVCLSRSTLLSYVEEGRFPAPVDIGKRRVAWVSSEIDAWIEGLIAKRDSGRQ